jgi:DNA-binding CsgD family transcriptional regulator/tetratricopeptide (TPR) repeat protein
VWIGNVGYVPVRRAMPAFQGRDAQLEALRDAMARAAAGHLTIVIVEGEAGIGKSRLLAAALDVARGRDLHVMTGRSEELERNRPFGLWTDALGCVPSSPDPRRAALGGLLAPRPDGQQPITVSNDPGLQFQAVDGVVDLVDELAHRRPLVLGLDDLQWADPASVLTLAALTHQLPDAPVLIVGCLRPTPRSFELTRALAVLGTAGARELRLGPLPNRAVAGLVADVLGAPPGPRLLSQVAGAGGNPLFVTELLGALVREGCLHAVDAQAEVSGEALPPSLRLTILRHLSFLPDDTLQVLRPASVLGSSFSVLDLTTTTRRSALDLAATLDPAISASVLVEDGDRLRFRHDLIRDAVYEDMPRGIRMGLHREAGLRLADAGAPALRVAEHLARGAASGDAGAVAWLTRAARETATRSPEAAAELFGRAVELAERSDADRLVVEEASSLLSAGRLRDAEARCRAALDRTPDRAVEESLRNCLAQALVAQGRTSDGLRELERLLRSATLADAERALAWAWTSMARLALGDLDGADAAAGRALSVAPDDGGHLATCIALGLRATAVELRGRPHKALQLIDEAIERADRSPDREGHRYPMHAARARMLMELDCFDDAEAALEAANRITQRLGTRRAYLDVYRGFGHFATGDWDDAVTELEAGVALAAETGQRTTSTLGFSILALIALHRGDLRRAGEAAGQAIGEVEASGPRFRSQWGAWVRALLLDARGAPREAFTTMAACWDECLHAGLEIELPVLGPDLVRMALAAGDRDRAAQVTDEVARLAKAEDVASHRGAARRCQGLLDGDPEPLIAAVDDYTRTSRLPMVALAAEDAAIALARTGGVGGARPFLDRALVTFEGIGAARDVARVEARMRALGVRRGVRGPRVRPRTGWASLTPTERTVVDLVAEGLSNPQVAGRMFLSRRTVQTHLAHVFGKLDITSRAELAAEAARRAAHPQR